MLKPTAVEQLNAAFAQFDVSLRAEEELTEPDKTRIRGEVVAALRAGLESKFENPFAIGATETRSAAPREQRSVAGIKRMVDLAGFNILDVGDMGPETIRQLDPASPPFSA